jgi:hypothetical protein
MKRKQILVGMALSLCFMIFLGCTSLESSVQLKTIEISTMGARETIDYTEKPVNLMVLAMNCNITVTKRTSLAEVHILGMHSTVRVSRTHVFTPDITGTGSKIVYYD